MKKRLLSLLLCFIMALSLVPMSMFAIGYTEGDIPGTTGTGTESDPVVCDTFAEFKAAMENWDVACVKLSNAGSEKLPIIDAYSAAITVYGGPYNKKQLTIEGGSRFYAPITSECAVYDCLVFVPEGATLVVNGSGYLEFTPNGKNAFNAVIRNQGTCGISGVTLRGTAGGGNTYGRAVVNNGGYLEIFSGSFMGDTCKDGNGPYAAVWGESGYINITGGQFRATAEYGVSITEPVTALCISAGAGCQLTGGMFVNGIYTKGRNISTIIHPDYALYNSISDVIWDADYSCITSGTYDVRIPAYNITVSGEGNPAAYYEGEQIRGQEAGRAVALKADFTYNGCAFDKWVSDDVEIIDSERADGAYFIMPEKAVTVTATYKNTTPITPTDFKFTTQPQSGTAKKSEGYSFSWTISDTPDYYNLRVWADFTGAWAGLGDDYLNGTTGTVPYIEKLCTGNTSKYQIHAQKGGQTIYSDEFTVTWTDASSVLLGDVDNDGEVTMADVTRIRRFLTDAEKYPLTVENAADVDNDGEITMADVTRIRRFLTDADKYPLGK